MAHCSLKRGNYRIWTPDEIADVTRVILSPCTSRVGLLSGKCVKVLQFNFKSLTCKEICTYRSDFEIEDLKWSPNSEALLLLSLRSCQFVVLECSCEGSLFRVHEPNMITLMSVEWVPDSKQLISISSCNIYTFVHILSDGRRILLPSICSTKSLKPLFSFSHDGKYVAFINFKNHAYHIVLMSTSSWCMLWSKKTDLITIEGLEWSPNSTMLAVWDSSKHVSFLDSNGELIKKFQYNNFMASSYIITAFAPESDIFVSACSQDQANVILIYNLITWQLSSVLNDEIKERFCLGNPEETEHRSNQLETHLTAKSQIVFSCCGTFIATVLSGVEVKIWNVREGLELTEVLTTQSYFAGLQWHSKKPQLAVSTGNGIVSVWKYSQDGPVVKPATLFSTNVNLKFANSLTWSKSNLIITSNTDTLKFIILIKNKKK